MGFAIALMGCWSCGKVFGCNPGKVPSIPIDPETNLPPDMGGDPDRAELQPVCPSCVTAANERRRARGLPLIRVLPGAYEVVPASELA